MDNNKTVDNIKDSRENILGRLARAVFVNNWPLKLTALVSAFICWLVMSIS